MDRLYLVRNTVSDRLFHKTESNWIEHFEEQKEKRQKARKEQKEEISSQQVKDTSPSHKLSEYQGIFFHPGYGRINVSLKEDSLFASSGSKKMFLKHVHFDVFEPFEVTKHGIDTSENGPVKFNFITNDAGEIASVKIKLEPALDHAIEFIHVPAIMELESSQLLVYEGNYELSGMVVKVKVNANNNLCMIVPGQPEYQLLASDKNLFILKDLDGYKAKFTEDAEGKITELIMIQPNGTFKAQRK